MGFLGTFFDKVLGFDPPKPPPPPVIKQKQVTEVIVVGPEIKQTVGPGPSADAETIQILANALVANEASRSREQAQNEASRSREQAQLVNQLFKSRTAQALNGRQATQVPQPAINQITGESSTTEMAIVVGFLVVLAALTTSKRKGR